jgi:hypothetical protein
MFHLAARAGVTKLMSRFENFTSLKDGSSKACCPAGTAITVQTASMDTTCEASLSTTLKLLEAIGGHCYTNLSRV